jgi:hypothetical protein
MCGCFKFLLVKLEKLVKFCEDDVADRIPNHKPARHTEPIWFIRPARHG